VTAPGRSGRGPCGTSPVSELLECRNRWAHQENFSGDDTYRVLDPAGRLLTAVSVPQADEIDSVPFPWPCFLPTEGLHQGRVHTFVCALNNVLDNLSRCEETSCPLRSRCLLRGTIHASSRLRASHTPLPIDTETVFGCPYDRGVRSLEFEQPLAILAIDDTSHPDCMNAAISDPHGWLAMKVHHGLKRRRLFPGFCVIVAVAAANCGGGRGHASGLLGHRAAGPDDRGGADTGALRRGSRRSRATRGGPARIRRMDHDPRSRVSQTRRPGAARPAPGRRRGDRHGGGSLLRALTGRGWSGSAGACSTGTRVSSSIFPADG